MDDVLAIEQEDVQAAAASLLDDETLGARDALHLAVMAHHGIARVFSFDRDFDGRTGIERIV